MKFTSVARAHLADGLIKLSLDFKKLGDAAKYYCSTLDTDTVRIANTPLRLSNDIFHKVEGLCLSKIKLMCSDSVFKKSKSFEVRKSEILSTQVFPADNKIEGEFRAAVIHDQGIDWGNSDNTTSFEPFSNSTVKATCTCKYYLKITEEKTQNERKYCSHIIGQLRRVIFML